jgi:dolichol-phosphate mannosyltransferase
VSEAPALAVVVPVYNEGPTIEEGLRAIVGAALRHPGRSVVIAVDDGSTDGSRETLTRLAGELDGLEVELHERNQGYGQALRTGAARARREGYDYAAFIDSDLTNPPEDLLTIGRLAAEGHTYIKASRFIPGGSMASVPARRRGVSVLGNLVGSALFGAGVRDVTNGFRAVRLDLLERWPLHETDFSCIVEELSWALRDGVRPVEFPSTLTARTEDQRASAFPYSARLIGKYLTYALRARARRSIPWQRS